MTSPGPAIVTGTRTLMIAQARLVQSDQSGALPPVPAGAAFWARTADAAGPGPVVRPPQRAHNRPVGYLLAWATDSPSRALLLAGAIYLVFWV
jgi:hypothetical protein